MSESLINSQVTIPQWLSLSQPIRMKLKQIFNIPRSGGTHIQDSVVLTDGHTHDDLKKISVEAMQKYVESTETDFWKLLDRTLERISEECEREVKEANDRKEEERRNDSKSRRETLLNSMENVERMANSIAEDLSEDTSYEQKKAKRRGRPPKVK